MATTQSQAGISGGAVGLTRTITPRELVAWCVLLLLVSLYQAYRLGGVRLVNDSYQYLSVAENIRDHHVIGTSIVYFDTERASRRIPAPFTTFPPGYPVAIWMVALTGWSLPHSAFAVSLASSLVVLVLLYATARLLSFPGLAARVCLLLWAMNFEVITFTTTVMSEAIFTVFVLASVVLILWRDRGDGPRWAAPVSFLLVGLSFWIRYAGLFMFLGLALYELVRVHFTKPARNYGRLIALVPGLAPILSGMLRNLYITGTWRGGNTKVVHNPAMWMLKGLVVAMYRLVAGERHRPGLPEFVLVTLAIALVATIIWVGYSTGAWRKTNSQQSWALLLLAVCIALYSAGITYASAVTVISLGVRMFFPILPAFILLFGIVFALLWPELQSSHLRRPLRFLLAFFAISYTAVTFRCVLAPHVPDEHDVVTALLAEPSNQGESLSDWFNAHVPSNAVIVAADGQASGYALRRPTLGLTEAHFTEMSWDENQLQKLMTNYAANYLLVYTMPSDAVISEESESAFLAELANGKPPGWLQQVAANTKARVFRRVPWRE